MAAYLTVPGIKGPIKDARFPYSIEVHSISGLNYRSRSPEMQVSAEMCAATSAIAKMVQHGTIIAGPITVHISSSSRSYYYVYSMWDCRFSSYSVSGAGQSSYLPTVDFTIQCRKFDLGYR